MSRLILSLSGLLLLFSGMAFAQVQLSPPPVPGQPGIQQPAVRPAPPSPQSPVTPRVPRPLREPVPPNAAPDPRSGLIPDVAPGSQEETVIAPPKQKITNPTAVFSGLDKVTGRIIVFDVAIDETVQFGALQVTPRICYTRPPTETPQTTSFVEVAEVTLQGDVRRLFTGWMFAASPGLSGVEHAVYDVWLVDCKQTAPVIPGQSRR